MSETKHVLKIHPAPFQAVLSGEKVHEFRRNDRDFRENDVLLLREFVPCVTCGGSRRMWANGDKDDCDCTTTANPGGTYTGREVTRRITYITRCEEWGGVSGFVVLSIAPVSLPDAGRGEEKEEKEPTCGLCGRPINRSDAVGYYGTFIAHRKERCIELLRTENARLREERDDAIKALPEWRELVALLHRNAKGLPESLPGESQVAYWQRIGYREMEQHILRAQLATAEAEIARLREERDAIRSCVEVPDGALNYDRFFEIVREGHEAKARLATAEAEIARLAAAEQQVQRARAETIEHVRFERDDGVMFAVDRADDGWMILTDSAGSTFTRMDHTGGEAAGG